MNPMLGHRGCRLGIIYPEITEMQARAIFEAACKVKKAGVDVKPEIMIPLVGHVNELTRPGEDRPWTAKDVFAKAGTTVDYIVGTMIEIPRAALTADEIASVRRVLLLRDERPDADDLRPVPRRRRASSSPSTSARDLPADPFQRLDQVGVGKLMKMGVELGRTTRPKLKIGICGEHGGEPSSVKFCHRAGLDYVSCSPFRVPIARLAAAQAAVRDGATVSGNPARKPRAQATARPAARPAPRKAAAPAGKAGKAAPKAKAARPSSKPGPAPRKPARPAPRKKGKR